eukprot:31955_1
MDDKLNSKQWAYHKRGRKKINKNVKTCNITLQLSANYISFNRRSNELNTIQYVGYRTTKNNIKQIPKKTKPIHAVHHNKHYIIECEYAYMRNIYYIYSTKSYAHGTKQNNRAKRKIENIIEVKHYMKYIQEKQQIIHDSYINDVTEINTKQNDYDKNITYFEYKKQKKKPILMKSKIQNELDQIFWVKRHPQFAEGIETNLSPFKCELLIFGYNKFKHNNLYMPDVISNLIMHFYYLGGICNMRYKYAPNGLMQYNKDKIIFTQQHSSSIDNILISNKGLEMNKKYVFRVKIINSSRRNDGIGIIKSPELIIDYMNPKNGAWWTETKFARSYREFRGYSEGDLVEIYIQLNSNLPSIFIIDKNGKYVETKKFDVDNKSTYYPYIAWSNRFRDEYTDIESFEYRDWLVKQKVSFELLY